MKPNLRIAALACIIVVLSAGVAAIAASIVRNTFVHALSTATALSNVRRDVDQLRMSFADQTTALMRYGRSRNVSYLAAFRSQKYKHTFARAASDVRRAHAEDALPALQRASVAYAKWAQRTDAAIRKDSRIFTPPAQTTSRARRRNGFRFLSDLERTNGYINNQLSEVDTTLDRHEYELNRDVAAQLPLEFALFAFVAFALAASGIAALINRQRFFNERHRTGRMSQAFGNVSLPYSPHVELDGMLVPVSAGDMVGGDWYDAHMLPDGRIFLTIGDVTGHGIEAAVTMMETRRSLLGAAIGEHDPAAVLITVNKDYDVSRWRTVSTICAYYDPAARELRYASAGFPAPLIREASEARLLEYGGPPLGVDCDFPFESNVVALNTGNVVVFYSDGLIDIDHDSLEGELLLRSVASRIDLDRFAQRLYHALFTEQVQNDDVAILTLRPI